MEGGNMTGRVLDTIAGVFTVFETNSTIVLEGLVFQYDMRDRTLTYRCKKKDYEAEFMVWINNDKVDVAWSYEGANKEYSDSTAFNLSDKTHDLCQFIKDEIEALTQA